MLAGGSWRAWPWGEAALASFLVALCLKWALFPMTGLEMGWGGTRSLCPGPRNSESEPFLGTGPGLTWPSMEGAQARAKTRKKAWSQVPAVFLCVNQGWPGSGCFFEFFFFPFLAVPTAYGILQARDQIRAQQRWILNPLHHRGNSWMLSCLFLFFFFIF